MHGQKYVLKDFDVINKQLKLEKNKNVQVIRLKVNLFTRITWRIFLFLLKLPFKYITKAIKEIYYHFTKACYTKIECSLEDHPYYKPIKQSMRFHPITNVVTFIHKQAPDFRYCRPN